MKTERVCAPDPGDRSCYRPTNCNINGFVKDVTDTVRECRSQIWPETVVLEHEAVPCAAISDCTNHFSLVNTLGESEFDLACSIE